MVHGLSGGASAIHGARAEGHRSCSRTQLQGRPEAAAKWLDTLGDPYTRTGADRNGRVGIDWGVYGVPETFVVTSDGRIAYKHIGPVRPEDLDGTILPLIEELRQP